LQQFYIGQLLKMLRCKLRISTGLMLAVFGLALAGCSPLPALEQLPESIGGLSPEAPARPDTPYPYPAVHDLPPSRATKTMSDAELLNAENALRAARSRQEKLQGAAEAGKEGR
jgi:hypothetical protein